MTQTSAKEMVERLTKTRVLDIYAAPLLPRHQMVLDDIGKTMGEAATLIASLAEANERLTRAGMARETRALSQAQDWRNIAEKAEARALAAEAALAKAVEDEREACATVMDAEATFAAENLAVISDEENAHWGNDIKVRCHWRSRTELAERAAKAIRSRSTLAAIPAQHTEEKT